jgi:hypothetical protein
MKGELTSATSIRSDEAEPRELKGIMRSLASAVFILHLGSATGHGIRRCLLSESAATQLPGISFDGNSTELRELSPEIMASLDVILNAAHHDIIEDGMNNTVNQWLPNLIAKAPNAVIAALVPAIETGSIKPFVAAEVLKELGQVRNVAPNQTVHWILERCLNSSSQFLRDGAGLGLARLADPATIPSLRRAVKRETDPQVRADLQLVIDEISETFANGALHADRY